MKIKLEPTNELTAADFLQNSFAPADDADMPYDVRGEKRREKRVLDEEHFNMSNVKSLDAEVDARAAALWEQGDIEGVRRLFERVLASIERRYGPDHPDAAYLLTTLAFAHNRQGDLDGAEKLLARALAIREKALDPDDPKLASSLHSLGLILRKNGDLGGAEKLTERGLAIREEALDPGNPEIAESLSSLGSILWEKGDLQRAESMLKRALAIHEEAFAPNDPDIADNLRSLGLLLRKKGDLQGAERLLMGALDICEKALDPDDPEIGDNLRSLGLLLHEKGDVQRGERFLERALNFREATLDPDHPEIAESLCDLAYSHYARDSLSDARSLYQRALAILEKMLDPTSGKIAICLGCLGQTLSKQGDFAGARTMLNRALKLRTQALGSDHPSLSSYRSALADVELKEKAAREAGTPENNSIKDRFAVKYDPKELSGQMPEETNLANDALPKSAETLIEAALNLVDNESRPSLAASLRRAFSAANFIDEDNEAKHHFTAVAALVPAPALPSMAPELWAKRDDRSERPPEFIRRVYQPWLGHGLTQAHINHIDKQLYMALHNWLRHNELPSDLALPTKSEHGTLQLAGAGLLGADAERLVSLAQSRIARQKRRAP